MALIRRSIYTTVTVLLAGCAVFDPYIKQDAQPTNTRVSSCVTSSGTPEVNKDRPSALRFACQNLVTIENARSQIVRTQSGMIATLVPLAGVIGYNTARQINGPTSAVMATGGVAAYTVGSTLAQGDRIRVYDAGITSVSCAISVYQRAMATTDGESPESMALSELIQSTRNDVTAAAQTAQSDWLIRTDYYLAALDKSLQSVNDSRSLDAQLTESVRKSVSDLNQQLTNTVPNLNSSLSGSFGIFASNKIGPSNQHLEQVGAQLINEAEKAAAANKTILLAGPSTNYLLARLTAIRGLYMSIRQDHQEVTANFSDCKFSLATNAGVQMPLGRLLLGAADSYNGRTIELAPKDSISIPIFGGTPPYGVLIMSGPQPWPSAAIATNNGVSSVAVGPIDAKASVGSEYIVGINDASGQQAKQFKITIVAAH